MPVADPRHPLAPALLLRILRLNCLTDAYADLWAEIFPGGQLEGEESGDPGVEIESLAGEEWAVEWPGLPPLSADIGPEWTAATPLRTERARRAALVELDALVAVWLGMSVDHLIAIYRSRFPVLADRESRMWFDANGRRIAGDYNTFGYGQTKDHFEQLVAHLDPGINGPVPEGYSAPFYKADREAEYRQAHAVFSKRLHESGWRAPFTRGGKGGES